MKSSIFTALLAAAIGFAPLYAAGTASKADAENSKKTQPAKKAKKKKRPLTLEQAMKRATTPALSKRYPERRTAKKEYAAANKDKIKILMIGDSITHQWESPRAAAAFKKYIAPYQVLNLGFGGDRTEHTLWMVEKSGILEMIKPQLVTIMIGTNNRYPYQATAAGIKRIVDSVRKYYPEAKILLYAIFPRGVDNNDKLRKVNDQVNDVIVKYCDGKNTIWVDIRKNFLTPEGVLEKSFMPDLLHPRNYKGYAVWGESLKPYFEKYGK